MLLSLNSTSRPREWVPPKDRRPGSSPAGSENPAGSERGAWGGGVERSRVPRNRQVLALSAIECYPSELRTQVTFSGSNERLAARRVVGPCGSSETSGWNDRRGGSSGTTGRTRFRSYERRSWCCLGRRLVAPHKAPNPAWGPGCVVGTNSAESILAALTVTRIARIVTHCKSEIYTSRRCVAKHAVRRA